MVCLICDDLGWINYNYQMECLNGIIGKNNANNKKIKFRKILILSTSPVPCSYIILHTEDTS